jgi:hypothetical protein
LWKSERERHGKGGCGFFLSTKANIIGLAKPFVIFTIMWDEKRFIQTKYDSLSLCEVDAHIRRHRRNPDRNIHVGNKGIIRMDE